MLEIYTYTYRISTHTCICIYITHIYSHIYTYAYACMYEFYFIPKSGSLRAVHFQILTLKYLKNKKKIIKNDLSVKFDCMNYFVLLWVFVSKYMFWGELFIYLAIAWGLLFFSFGYFGVFHVARFFSLMFSVCLNLPDSS